MQSFLESLNYYSRFIRDFAIYAFVSYELREADLHEINRADECRMSVAEVDVRRKPYRESQPDKYGSLRSGINYKGRSRRSEI